MKDRSTEAIESRDLEGVAVAEDPQDLVEPGPAGFRAAGVVDVDVVLGDPGALERVDLMVGILLGG